MAAYYMVRDRLLKEGYKLEGSVDQTDTTELQNGRIEIWGHDLPFVSNTVLLWACEGDAFIFRPDKAFVPTRYPLKIVQRKDSK